jgi:hypothetical protein
MEAPALRAQNGRLLEGAPGGAPPDHARPPGTHMARMVERFRVNHAGLNGRYWARTSDPQLVDHARPLAISCQLAPKVVAKPNSRSGDCRSWSWLAT